MKDVYVIDECFKRKTFENLLRSSIYNDCRRMEKADVYEWVYNNELKIKQLSEERDKYKSIVEMVKEDISRPSDKFIEMYHMKERQTPVYFVYEYKQDLKTKIKELEEGNSNE